MGRLHLELKDFKKAKEAFEESVQINPFNPEAHLGMAQAYEALADKTSAVKEMEIAKRLSQ
jgi:Tfp pilus assembly protein PilF